MFLLKVFCGVFNFAVCEIAKHSLSLISGEQQCYGSNMAFSGHF